eukprot:4002872-Karenia_brevis.AAC.1
MICLSGLMMLLMLLPMKSHAFTMFGGSARRVGNGIMIESMTGRAGLMTLLMRQPLPLIKILRLPMDGYVFTADENGECNSVNEEGAEEEGSQTVIEYFDEAAQVEFAADEVEDAHDSGIERHCALSMLPL